jgi:hypothetical protein
VLFTDADGATNIECLEKVLVGCKEISKNDLGCVVGSRKEGVAVVERKGLRKFLAWCL